MKIHSKIPIVVCACLLIAAIGGLAQDLSGTETNRPGLKTRQIFSGSLTVRGRNGSSEVPVTIHTFSVWGSHRITDLQPLNAGFAILECTGGKAVTTFQSLTNRSQSGDFVLVAGRSNPVFQSAKEATSFEAVVLGGPFAESEAGGISGVSAHRARKSYAPMRGGLLEREAMPAQQVGDYKVAVRQLLVGPGQKTAPFGIPGASLLEVTSGGGELRIGSRTRSIKGGDVLTVIDGEELEVTNRRQDLGLCFRVVNVSLQ